MKKILLLSSFLFILSCGENNVFVTRDTKNKTSFFIDKNSIKKANEGITAWVIVNHQNPEYYEKRKYYSLKSKFLFDCSNGRYKILDIYIYSEDMGKGTLLGNEKPRQGVEDNWEPASSGEPVLDVIKYVCK